MQIRIILLYLLLLFINKGVKAGHTQKSIIDLTQQDLDNNEATLSGKWEFYWNELLGPNEISKTPSHGFLIQVPSNWAQEARFPILGYGTYHTVILLPKNYKDLSLFFPLICSSSRIWLNGKLIEESGTVDKNREKYQAKLGSIMLSVPQNSTKVDIVIQVANYTYMWAGITKTVYIGGTTALFRTLNIRHGIENFFIGGLIAMFIYHFMLFLLYQKDRSYLYLSIICLVVGIRGMIVNGGSFLLPDLLPAVSFEIWKKIECLGVYATAAFFPLYIHTLFAKESSRLFIKVVSTISAFFCFIILGTPQYIYGQLLNIIHMLYVVDFIFASIVIFKAWKRGSSDAKIIFFGVLVAFPFILFEILNNSTLIRIGGSHLVELGVLLFLLFQSFLLANRNATANNNLTALNANLEKIVIQRTADLTKANQLKENLLSIISHDIKGPLNSLKGILNLFNMKILDTSEIKGYTIYIEDELQRTTIMTENILSWTSSQILGININFEVFNLSDLITEHIIIFDSLAQRKSLNFENQAEENVPVLADKNVVSLVLRNLFSNAIKFSREGGSINLSIKRMADNIIFSIKDEGIGIPPEKLKILFEVGPAKTTRGTKNEKGTGLGLVLCHEYLLKMNSSIEVESLPGKGTRFSILLASAPRH